MAPPPPSPGPPPGRSGPGWGRRLVALLDEPLGEPGVSPGGDRDGPAGRIRSWRRSVTTAISAHPLVTDAALTVVLAVISTPWLLRLARPEPWSLIVQAALLVPLVWRRRHPVGVFALVSAVAFVQYLTARPLVADLVLLVALYTVSVRRPWRTALGAAAVIEVGVILAIARWTLTGDWIHSLVFLTGLVAAALLLGINVRTRRAHLATLIDRAERLQREQDQQTRMAAVAERTRIAREMHDVLAHSLAVMISLADGAAAKVNTEPARAATAIAHVSDLGRQSLRDTRRLLGVLRADDGPGPTAPQPDVSQLDDLLGPVRATGLDASLHVDGEPFAIPPAAGLTVYRIVQEALTNCLKHSAGARSVRVTLRYRDPDLDVDVRDDGFLPWPAADAGDRPPSSGHGLAGMRERASVHQGSVAAGPDPDGGWRVTARLPVGPGSRR